MIRNSWFVAPRSDRETDPRLRPEWLDEHLELLALESTHGTIGLTPTPNVFFLEEGDVVADVYIVVKAIKSDGVKLLLVGTTHPLDGGLPESEPLDRLALELEHRRRLQMKMQSDGFDTLS